MDRESTAARVANWRLRRVSTLAMVGRVALRVFFPWRRGSQRLRFVLLGECELENCTELQVA